MEKFVHYAFAENDRRRRSNLMARASNWADVFNVLIAFRMGTVNALRDIDDIIRPQIVLYIKQLVLYVFVFVFNKITYHVTEQILLKMK